MPTYQAGDHKVDHPPLFACREHKQFLRFTEKFIKDVLGLAADIVPANLSEAAAPMLGGNGDGFKLPEYLIPPRVVLYNPSFLKGPAALPFTIIFIDKKFVGIPAAYLTSEKFEGCAECELNPPAPEPVAQPVAQPVVRRPSAPAATATGSGASRPQTGNVPTVRPPSGPLPVAKPGGPPRPAGAPPPKRPPGPGVAAAPAKPGTEGSGVIRRGPPPPGAAPPRPRPPQP